MITNISRAREAISVTGLGSGFLYIAGGYDGHKYLTGKFLNYSFFLELNLINL